LLERALPLYSSMPRELRERLEPHIQAFLFDIEFVGCNGLEITDEIRVTIAAQACLLTLSHDPSVYSSLHSVLVYPEEFVVEEQEVDDAGVVSEGSRALSGQTLDTAAIVLSWSDVLESRRSEEPYNVVLHEFAHYLDHSVDGALTRLDSRHRALESWHAIIQREYDALCDAVERDEPTLIDPYGAEDPAEFFAVATETFFEAPLDMRELHPQLYEELKGFYGLDPAAWLAA